MHVTVTHQSDLRLPDGSPVRAASGLVAYDGGWLVVQDDSTLGCHWRGGACSTVRLLDPVEGHEVFDEASGTKALKPDLEAAVALPGGAVLLLGSGSTPARMRWARLAPDGGVRVSDASALYGRLLGALGVGPGDLNLEGACVVGETLRWFQRGLPSAGVPTASVDLAVADLDGDPDQILLTGLRTYDLGVVDGVGLAVTDAVTLPDGRVLVSAAAEDSASTYDDGPVVGSALALLDGPDVVELAPLPRIAGRVAKVEGLALRSSGPEGLDLVAVIDVDDPRVPSPMLGLRIEPVTTRLETSRTIAAPPADIFALLCDPQGHVAIDSSGMLQDADGEVVTAAGDSFVVHMDRESLNDYPQMGRYDVTVTIQDFEPDRLISWTILTSRVRPHLGHVYGYRLEPQEDGATLVTSFYDWSDIHPDYASMDIFPVISEEALRETLGILDRTVRRGYVRP